MSLLDELLNLMFGSPPPKQLGPVEPRAMTPRPPAGEMQSRDLAYAHPELRRRYALLKADFRAQTGRDLFETCVWRSSAQQNLEWLKGRRGIPGEKIVTKIDGITKLGNHNRIPSRAVDVCVDIDPGPGKHVVWDHPSYDPLGPLADRHGLIWGGRWAQDDYPHLELPPEVA